MTATGRELIAEYGRCCSDIADAKQKYLNIKWDQYDRAVYERRCVAARAFEKAADARVEWISKHLTTDTLVALIDGYRRALDECDRLNQLNGKLAKVGRELDTVLVDNIEDERAENDRLRAALAEQSALVEASMNAQDVIDKLIQTQDLLLGRLSASADAYSKSSEMTFNPQRYTHLVVIIREGIPSVHGFRESTEAMAFADHAGAQWSETYVTQIIKGPLV